MIAGVGDGIFAIAIILLASLIIVWLGSYSTTPGSARSPTSLSIRLMFTTGYSQ